MLWVPISLQEVSEKAGVGRTPDGDEFLGLPCPILVGYEPVDTCFYSGSGLGAGPGKGKALASPQVAPSRRGMGCCGCPWSTAQTQSGLLLSFRVYQEAMPQPDSVLLQACMPEIQTKLEPSWLSRQWLRMESGAPLNCLLCLVGLFFQG